ncbi:hypothetical protein BBO99_00008543 [Phytophthora kernoviae]|uniref:G-protein coupled receptors family 2 profile 2 domain-containing protein n=2 Tax=Phytophthora kernoviae TaxID=325452 RepID=A0A3R7MJQ4_9STRA|nr:hypothetical protein G195_010119 [Phytophthora kernoviae 00238/432]KAG2513463.1 hypothetical protein JM18_008228 [Phytophthora kernoviae]RLM95703.1 hypothetical protein BBI17_008490 [Phytophthora kernoviae]RLN75101.1 hypothetical protein BBO99_00008543 [Phytophthora kernoviae]
MSDRHDAGPTESLTDAQQSRLQLMGFLSSSLSLLGSMYVLVHFGCVYWCKPRRPIPQQQLPLQFQPPRQRNRMDLMAKLVFVLALFDLVAVAARAVGRSVIDDYALCRTQAAVIQVANLASCIWICCIAFNLHRWIAGGESDATRQRRFPLFLAIALLPGAGLVLFHLMTDKYGDATYYCWLDQIRYMFLNFYLFYMLMIVFNFVLLALIHFNMKQRVARHDTVEADTSSMLIRRKLLLYIVVFVVHRTPMMVYRMEPKKISIFTSTFNMGEKNVNEHELRAWVPLGHDIYVIGAQECMDLADLQIKILRHLVSGSTSKYVHYSREIGKRATALGYHGYIALSIFVRATAVASGRFRMPHKQRSTKNAQEVFRGKSLLLFGRASNKASDSSSLKRTKRKKSSNAIVQAQNVGDRAIESNLVSINGRNSGGDSGESKTSVSGGLPIEMHQPPSKMQRRNQDAMEILQQLYLDEEDYGILHGEPSLNPLAARMKDVPGACELRLRIEFRSIHWIDAVDSALFDRAEHVQFGFLFPLPCEDVFAPQRKLHEVAEHLTFGGADSGSMGGMGFASTITPTSNFHTLKWHEFVNGGLRYHTLAGPSGQKFFGHGTFCAEDMTKKSEAMN